MTNDPIEYEEQQRQLDLQRDRELAEQRFHEVTEDELRAFQERREKDRK